MNRLAFRMLGNSPSVEIQARGKARFLALLRYGAWLEVAIDELATAIIMRRLTRPRPEHDAMTEGRETFPTARFLDLLRFSRATAHDS